MTETKSDPIEIVLEHVRAACGAMSRVREQVRAVFGPDVQCVVLGDGMDMGVVRQVDVAP